MRRFAVLSGLSCGLIAILPAAAADLPVKARPAQPAPYDWTGFYFGGHVGFGAGIADTTTTDPTPLTGHNHFGGALGGAQFGYNYVSRSGFLFGLETDMTFMNYLEANPVMASVPTPAGNSVTEQLDYLATFRARFGHVFGPMMAYATGGFAYSGGRVLNDFPSGDQEKGVYWRPGWVAGVGVEYAFAPFWTARAEYLYSHFNPIDVRLPSGAREQSDLHVQELRIGLSRKLDWPGTFQPGAWPAETPVGGDRWEVHAQTTYIMQGYRPFRELYSGPNSLPATGQNKATWSASAFVGLRLWDGGEFYFTPEVFQGFGLGGTTGLGGFANGEAQKSNFPYPRLTPTRAFIRETFGFGGEQEMLDSGPHQLSGKVDISRLTLQVGKFSVMDVFDGNAYAKDPRRDFMNWSIWGPGAFDYAADKVGLTYGATAEFNQKNWAIRGGYFLMDAQSNSNDMDMHLFTRGEYVAELEGRYQLFSQPGKVRLLGFVNSVYSGSYMDTLNNPILNLDISQTRDSRIKYGFGLNIEQAVTDDIGVFGRWNWNDGRTEIMAFTDIDRSLSFGASVKGTAWGRKDDTFGIGGAFNALSQDHRAFLAAGGLGVLVGDGALNYANEKILETFYSFSLFKGTWLTADYQFVTNPAFNRDRGPVSIFSGRLHAEF